MNMNDLISCIVTSFNSEQFIADAVNSILHQTYKNIEIIVADGGSVDNTKKNIQKYMMILIICLGYGLMLNSKRSRVLLTAREKLTGNCGNETVVD